MPKRTRSYLEDLTRRLRADPGYATLYLDLAGQPAFVGDEDCHEVYKQALTDVCVAFGIQMSEHMNDGMAYGSEDEPEAAPTRIRCPQCHLLSYNHQDIVERYCGFCHAFHADMSP
jgi:hypothetical protein